MRSPIGETPRCFISHAWCDEGHAFALEIRKYLSQQGVSSWIDERSIVAGEHLDSEIRHGVLRECNVFLAILSAGWVNSTPCQEELALALERRDGDGVQIIPILRETLPEPPKDVEGLLYIDWRDDSRVRECVDKLIKAITSAFFVYSMASRLLAGARHERQQAAQHVATLASPFLSPVLIRQLEKEVDPTTRYWLAIAIGKTDGRDGASALEQALACEMNAYVRSGIREALRMKGHLEREG